MAWEQRTAIPQQEIGEVIQLARCRYGRIERAEARPAAALRGFAKRGKPACSRSSFKRSKDRRCMTTSPRTSKGFAGQSDSSRTRSGKERMVRAFSVTSSPTRPSPRVSACSKRLVVVMRGHRKAVELQLRHVFVRIRLSAMSERAHRNRAVPASLSALSRLSIGELCGTLTNPSRGWPPTRWVGESGVRSSGCASSRSAQLAHRAVVFSIGDLGLIENVVEVFVMFQLLRAALPRAFGATLSF